jgi:TonB family protein
MRTVVFIVMCIGAVCACSRIQRPVPARAPVAATVEPAAPDPFDDTPASFVIAGARFAPGEKALVKVCVSPDGSIASTEVIVSSGDKRFDDLALDWARQVKLRDTPQRDAARELCGAVRVEIKSAPSHRALSGVDNLLG